MPGHAYTIVNVNIISCQFLGDHLDWSNSAILGQIGSGKVELEEETFSFGPVLLQLIDKECSFLSIIIQYFSCFGKTFYIFSTLFQPAKSTTTQVTQMFSANFQEKMPKYSSLKLKAETSL